MSNAAAPTQTVPDLQSLRDIHLPDPVPFWPPSASVWFLLILLIAIVAGLAYLFRHQIKQRALRRVALRELTRIERSALPPPKRLDVLATLMRRVALSRFEQSEVAPLTGFAWLAFLDKTYDPTGQANLFREGAGKLLGDARYIPEHALQKNALEELQILIKLWIERVC